MSVYGSSESLYKSAPSESDDDDDSFMAKTKRPNFLSGTSESSLIEDESGNLSSFENLKNKLNQNLAKVFNLKHGFGSSSADDLKFDPVPEPKILAKIVGFEILEKEKKLTVYKLKVRHCGHWGVDQIPNWSLYRRYNDFYRLHQNLITDFPEAILKFPPKRWIGDNYDSIFIGQRISNLNKYLDSVLKNKDLDVRDSHYVNDFLCLGSPPSRSTSISSCRALYDCFEETVRELRHQLRKKETLEEVTDGLREALIQRDIELESLRNEAEQLRKQREALIKAFDNGNHYFNNSVFGLKSITSGPPSEVSQSSAGFLSSGLHHQAVDHENDSGSQ